MKDLASHKESYTIHTITVETFMIPKQLIVWIQYSIANQWLSLANSCVKIRIFVQTSTEPSLLELYRVQPKLLVGKMHELNNLVEILITQHTDTGTCKSAYTKGYALN